MDASLANLVSPSEAERLSRKYQRRELRKERWLHCLVRHRACFKPVCWSGLTMFLPISFMLPKLTYPILGLLSLIQSSVVVSIVSLALVGLLVLCVSSLTAIAEAEKRIARQHQSPI